MSRIKADSILLGGDGGVLVRGVMTDEQFVAEADEWIFRKGKTWTPLPPGIKHGWWRWVPDLDEGGSLLYQAEAHSRGAFRASVLDAWEYKPAERSTP